MEAWLGDKVLMEYVGGQSPENGARRETGAGDTVAEVRLWKTARFVLENTIGSGSRYVSVRTRSPQFLSWGAILRIAGTDQEPTEDLEEAERRESRGNRWMRIIRRELIMNS